LPTAPGRLQKAQVCGVCFRAAAKCGGEGVKAGFKAK